MFYKKKNKIKEQEFENLINKLSEVNLLGLKNMRESSELGKRYKIEDFDILLQSLENFIYDCKNYRSYIKSTHCLNFTLRSFFCCATQFINCVIKNLNKIGNFDEIYDDISYEDKINIIKPMLNLLNLTLEKIKNKK